MAVPQTKRQNTGATWEFFRVLSKFVFDMGRELLNGVKYQQMPWQGLLITSTVMVAAIAIEWDRAGWRDLGLKRLPNTLDFPWFELYVLLTTMLPFCLWAMVKVTLRYRAFKQLKAVFINAGLKNALNQIPAVVSDRAIDGTIRALKLTRAHLPKSQFEKAVPTIESALKVYIDELVENRTEGTIELIYAHKPMPELVQLDNYQLQQDAIVIGKTRSTEISIDLDHVPHLLIAGQTGGGKSTFARQLITSLYLSNPSYKFLLVDLKGGLEFQTFSDLPRVAVVSQLAAINARLEAIDREMTLRFEVLKANQCKDLKAYRKLPPAQRTMPMANANLSLDFDRLVIVVDEIAELFLANIAEKYNKASEAKAVLSRVSRLGRAVGIHLIAGTQRPDAKVVDTQIKANMTGKVCFQMSDIASSMVVLGNARAKSLPAIAGRAIWQCGMSCIEVQVPYLSVEETDKLLADHKTQ